MFNDLQMDDFVLCGRKYSLPVVRHYWNIRIKDFRKTTKSEWTKGHNQWRKPLNSTQVRLSKISKIICQVKEERYRKRERKKTIWIRSFLTVVMLGMHIFREVIFFVTDQSVPDVSKGARTFVFQVSRSPRPLKMMKAVQSFGTLKNHQPKNKPPRT